MGRYFGILGRGAICGAAAGWRGVIERTERKIDALVHRLYGLSEDERETTEWAIILLGAMIFEVLPS